MKQQRIRDYHVLVGSLSTGPKNKITDVLGVTVGHVTLKQGSMHTGVTAIIPHQGNIFRGKVIAASHVFNGFGKSIGTVQIDELGTIETPIILTSTLSVGVCADGLVETMLEQVPEIGRSTGTMNPVVCECNDMKLNDIRAGYVKKEHVKQAIIHAKDDFEEGGVGAGTGMVCFGLKGGIGSASRLMTMDHGNYTLGVLVLANFGRVNDLIVNGQPLGQQLSTDSDQQQDQGSIIIIVATDLPVSERQLKRIIKRSAVGLVRTGSFIGNGSGDIVIGFSTANKVNNATDNQLNHLKIINESDIDQAFDAVAEATEEAILNALITAESSTGRQGHHVRSLKEHVKLILPH